MNKCKRCGRKLMRGFAILCICLVAEVGGDPHPHREAFRFKPTTTQIAVVATTGRQMIPPLVVNGQEYRVT